jgi:hypothetical protein
MQNHCLNLLMDPLENPLMPRPVKVGWEASIESCTNRQFRSVGDRDYQFGCGSVPITTQTWTDGPQPLLILLMGIKPLWLVRTVPDQAIVYLLHSRMNDFERWWGWITCDLGIILFTQEWNTLREFNNIPLWLTQPMAEIELLLNRASLRQQQPFKLPCHLSCAFGW